MTWWLLNLPNQERTRTICHVGGLQFLSVSCTDVGGFSGKVKDLCHDISSPSLHESTGKIVLKSVSTIFFFQYKIGNKKGFNQKGLKQQSSERASPYNWMRERTIIGLNVQ